MEEAVCEFGCAGCESGSRNNFALIVELNVTTPRTVPGGSYSRPLGRVNPLGQGRVGPLEIRVKAASHSVHWSPQVHHLCPPAGQPCAPRRARLIGAGCPLSTRGHPSTRGLQYARATTGRSPRRRSHRAGALAPAEIAQRMSSHHLRRGAAERALEG